MIESNVYYIKCHKSCNILVPRNTCIVLIHKSWCMLIILAVCCALFREEIASLTAQVQVANKKYQELSQGQTKNTGANTLSALPEVKKLTTVLIAK